MNNVNPFTVLNTIDEDYLNSIEDTPEHELITFAQELDDTHISDLSLPQLTYQLKKANYAYIKTGLIAFKVKYLKLYKRLNHKSFKQFCEQVIGLSVWRVNRLIQASKVALELISLGFDTLPLNEAQARCLVKIPLEQLQATWQGIINFYKDTVLTAYKIAEYLGIDCNTGNKRLRIESEDFLEYLTQKAVESDSTVEEYLQVTTGYKVNPVPEPELELTSPVHISNWYRDLQELSTQEYTLSSLLINVVLLLANQQGAFP